MSGQWWESDLIVGPFADIPAANAWAAANPSSLFPGLLATAGGAQYKWGGSGWVGLTLVGEYASPGQPLFASQSVGAGGWGLSGGGAADSLYVTSDVVRTPGVSTLCIDSRGSSADRYLTVRRKVDDLYFSGPLEFWFWVDAPSIQIDMIITYSSDTPANDPPNSAPTNRIGFGAFGSTYKPGAWNCVRVNPQNATIGIPGTTRLVTGTPNLSKVSQVSFYIFFSSAVEQSKRVAYVDIPTVGMRRKSKVLFTFDGTPQHALEKVDPLMAKYGIARPAIFNDRNDAISTALQKQYFAVMSCGWEVGCNGQLHTNYQQNPQLLDAHCANAEAFYVQAGIPKPTLFGCPVGANSGTVDGILASRGYVGCRGVGISTYKYDTTANYQSFGGVSIESGVTSDDTLSRIDAAIAANASIALLFHEVADTVAVPSVQVSTATFEAILSGIATRRANGLIDDTTMGDFCRYGR